MIDSKNPELYHLTKNVIEKNKWLGFQKRNVIEACLSVIILLLIHLNALINQYQY